MSEQWDLMKAMAKANNMGRDNELYKIIESLDCNAFPQATDCAINCAEMTTEKMEAYPDAFQNLAKSNVDDQLGWRAYVRIGLMRSTLKMPMEGKNNYEH